MLSGLPRVEGRPSLGHLHALDDDEAIDYLTGFKGVGTKTAACVLCFALGRPVMPVDTHVRRTSIRLGLVPDGSSAERAHRRLNEAVPRGLRHALHLELIALGRERCTARAPDCPACTLEDLCPRIGV